MMNLVEQVANAWQLAGQTIGRDLFREPIVVGVSGGPDSLALLHTLGRMLPPSHLIAAHLDHQLRPVSSEEAQFVARFATTLGVRCRMKQDNIRQVARDAGLTLEEAGRVARYRFLADVARQEGSRIIAVGHHADDQVETILMHFLRGSGPAGLRGMTGLSPLPDSPDLWLVRPLLDVTREEIEQYCREHRLRPRIDLSNADTTYHRNRLRHELLPILETYNPQIRRRLREMAAVMDAENDLLNQLTADAWQTVKRSASGSGIRLEHAAWSAQPLAIRRRLLRRALYEVQPNLRHFSFRALEAARRIAEAGRTGSQAGLPGGLRLWVEYADLVIRKEAFETPIDFPQLPDGATLRLTIPGSAGLANGWHLTAEIMRSIDNDLIRHNPDPWQCFIAADDYQELLVRARQPGERIRPLGLDGVTKVKEAMINRKIPSFARTNWPIVASPAHALWIVGHVLDDRARITSDSRRIVRLRCIREPIDSHELERG